MIKLSTFITVIFFTLSFQYKKIIPPGTQAIEIDNETLYVDKSEVLNRHWTEYLVDLRNEHGQEAEIYQNALPQMDLWKEVYPEGAITNYNSFANDFPIVGISYEQAVDFCLWRSQKVSELLGQKVIYRLPTEDEWTLIFQRTFDDKKDGFMEGLQAAHKVKKIINLTDNVSEMLATKGEKIGLNWKDFKEDSPYYQELIAVREYSQPEATLGFRCVAQVME